MQPSKRTAARPAVGLRTGLPADYTYTETVEEILFGFAADARPLHSDELWIFLLQEFTRSAVHSGSHLSLLCIAHVGSSLFLVVVFGHWVLLTPLDENCHRYATQASKSRRNAASYFCTVAWATTLRKTVLAEKPAGMICDHRSPRSQDNTNKGQIVKIETGSTVTATRHIWDDEIDGRARCVARPGDVGVVEYLDEADNTPTVRWSRSGRATICDEHEITADLGVLLGVE